MSSFKPFHDKDDPGGDTQILRQGDSYLVPVGGGTAKQMYRKKLYSVVDPSTGKLKMIKARQLDYSCGSKAVELAFTDDIELALRSACHRGYCVTETKLWTTGATQ